MPPTALERLQELAPFTDEAAAIRVFQRVLSQLSRYLLPEERRALSAGLPEAAHILRAVADTTPPDLTLVDAIAAAEGVTAALALEHLQLVIRAIIPELEGAGLVCLKRAVPELDWLWEPQADSQPQVEPHHGHRHTLAEGRPGSRHPLASAEPRQLAHQQSIARSDDPHGETKLSSARGLTQERLSETLADGEPGPKRPLSRA